MLGYLMYRSALVPPRMALLGLIGGPVLILSFVLKLCGVYEDSSGVWSGVSLECRGAANDGGRLCHRQLPVCCDVSPSDAESGRTPGVIGAFARVEAPADLTTRRGVVMARSRMGVDGVVHDHQHANVAAVELRAGGPHGHVVS